MGLVEDHIRYAEPHVRPVLETLRKRVQMLDERIIERPTPAQRIVYLVDRIFAEVKVQKQCALVRFFDTNIPDPWGLVHHIEHARKNGWQHDKEIRIFDQETIEYAMRFIEASYRSHLSTPLHNECHSEQPIQAIGAKMSTITIPAARVRQGDLILYTTALRVRELIRPGFYNVETLDPADGNDKGFQRLLNKARAKKLADYILKGQDACDAFLPTSVFLATDKSVAFNEACNTISFSMSEVGPFSVVDGQHRLEGLKMAAEKDTRVLDFEVPVNIAINLPNIHQMCHFLIVNTTQKSVDKSVEQRIIARLTEALDVEDMPSLPKWVLFTVEKGEVDKAIRYVDYLNSTDGSPWKGKIRMANDDGLNGTINQRSFVKSIVRYVLTANNPISVVKNFETEKRIFLNYWRAISNIIDDGETDTLYKYGGVELFCQFSIPFFMRLQNDGNNYTVDNMEGLLQSCFENIRG